MTKANVVACLAVLSFAAATTAGAARDVSPDPGGVNPGAFSESFAFAGEGRVTVFTGRGGFRTSESRGGEWRRAMTGYLETRGVEPYGNGFCVAPSDPMVLYSPSGQVDLGSNPAPLLVFRSADLGATWQAQGTILPGLAALDCAVDPRDASVVYVLAFDPFTGNEFLFRSSDGGSIWTASGPTFPSFASFIRVAANGDVYVTNPSGDAFDGIYRSSDGGGTFTLLVAAPALPQLMAITSTGALFVITANALLYRSLDSGASFELVASFPAGAKIGDIAASSSVVYVASPDGGLWHSTDGGSSFGPVTTLPPRTFVTAVGIGPSHGKQHRLFVGTWRGPYHSDDGAMTWTPISRSLRGATVNDLDLDAVGRLMVATFHTQAVYRARTSGSPRSYDAVGEALTTSARDVIGEWEANALAASKLDAQRAVVSTSFDGVFSTADGGATWTRAKVTPATSFTTRTRAAWAPGSATRVYLMPTNALFRSDDAGLSFTRVARGGFGALAVDPANPDVVYVGAFFGGPFNGLFKSVDGGTTLTSLGVPGSFRSLSIDTQGAIYAGNASGGVVRSADGGASWTDASAGLPGGQTLAVAADPLVAGRVYAWIQGAGLFASGDQGARWTAADTGEALRRSGVETGRASMAVDRVVPGRVYLGNSGVCRSTPCAKTTSAGRPPCAAGAWHGRELVCYAGFNEEGNVGLPEPPLIGHPAFVRLMLSTALVLHVFPALRRAPVHVDIPSRLRHESAPPLGRKIRTDDDGIGMSIVGGLDQHLHQVVGAFA